MATLWFVLVGFMLTMYVVLDGFDLGAGALHPFAARTEEERRLVLRSIGPVWDGNEVWLIAAGGTLFFSFPLLYASSFSGFYLPLMIVLWLLMLRGLAIELRGHFRNPIWTPFWDALFFLGSALLALFFGVAVGNVVRGVSLNPDGYFFLPLWTDLDPRGANPGVLDWYTVLIGLLAVATLVLHGANWLAVKVDGPLHDRAARCGGGAWLATAALTVPTTVATFWLRPAMLDRFGAHPWGYLFPAIAIGGLVVAPWARRRGRDLAALLGSGGFIVGMMASTAFALYPVVLPGVDPATSLTVHNAAGGRYGQTVGLVWWSIGMVLALTYFVLIYTLFRGKVRATDAGY
jgi:cytochrome bd ubiquinol oxidase subunit II